MPVEWRMQVRAEVTAITTWYNEVIAYCRIGERSSHTWFALRELLGYSNVKNYDGFLDGVRLPGGGAGREGLGQDETNASGLLGAARDRGTEQDCRLQHLQSLICISNRPWLHVARM